MPCNRIPVFWARPKRHSSWAPPIFRLSYPSSLEKTQEFGKPKVVSLSLVKFIALRRRDPPLPEGDYLYDLCMLLGGEFFFCISEGAPHPLCMREMRGRRFSKKKIQIAK